MTVYAAPGTADSLVTFKPRYDHFIGGEWVAPDSGQYFEDISPVNGKPFTEVARGNAADIDKAVDAAWKGFETFGKTSVVERSNLLLKLAQAIEDNLEALAVAETWENGKPIRETLAADIPLAADHFRYYAGVIRAQEGRLSQIDEDTVAYHFHEPLGVVGQIIPWNFPLLMAAWKIAPALATGNTIVLKPAEQTPASILFLVDLWKHILPPGVLNVVNGFGLEAGAPLSGHKNIRKIAFTGETTTGSIIMKAAAENIIPITLELGGKSPNIFFEDVARENDSFYQKALEGFASFGLNQGEVCTCPSRALVQKGIYDEFVEAGIERVRAMKQGNPLDTETMVGAQASKEQWDKITGYLQIGKDEGADVLVGGSACELGGDLADGFYIQPTVFAGKNNMRIFREEIFGPVLAATSFTDFDEAMRIANDTDFGLGAGVWTRDQNTAYRAGRAIQAGRVWINNYHNYPAHAAFGGYKKSGIGRENHLMMLD
ncbi:MAG: aldehyde dehydrogenase family protein, partial [Rothia sp. (in: high G+C Gram-positive bacteria)]|nr:aldehyde dehydrogenase family protein [Rothia sp. (in: high G+C Gram-positive bacteria)]